jgi:hypothetical protein
MLNIEQAVKPIDKNHISICRECLKEIVSRDGIFLKADGIKLVFFVGALMFFKMFEYFTVF